MPDTIAPVWRPVSWSSTRSYFSPSKASDGSAPAAIDVNKPLPVLPAEKQKTNWSSFFVVTNTLTEGVRCIAPRSNGSIKRGSIQHSPVRRGWTFKRQKPTAKPMMISRGTQTSTDRLPPLPPVLHSSGRSKGLSGIPVRNNGNLSSPDYFNMPKPESPVQHHQHSATITDLDEHRFQLRTSTQSMRNFLSNTSPSHPDLKRVSDSSSEHTTPRQDAVTARALLNMELIKPHSSPAHGLTKAEESGATVGSYESRYSESPILPAPAMPTTLPVPAPGIAVTQQGIINRPLVARRAMSDSAAAEEDGNTIKPLAIASPADIGGLVHHSGPVRPRSIAPRAPSARAPARLKVNAPPRSPLRREIKEDSPPKSGTSRRDSPTKNTPVEGDLGQGQIDQMSEWGKHSPTIFRRPVEGYFEILGAIDVTAPPDHLQGSWLCPLHPKNYNGQKSFCPIHGHLTVEEQSHNSRISGSGSGSSTPELSSQDLDSSMLPDRPPSPGGIAYWNNSRTVEYGQSDHNKPRARVVVGPSTSAPSHRTQAPAHAMSPARGSPTARFRLPGPDHSPGDPQCPAHTGKGVCVWHGRLSARPSPGEVPRHHDGKEGPIPRGW